MAYHVPFSQRQKQPPVYIGFDEPVRRSRQPKVRRRFNWWGFSGLMLSLLSVFTAFFLSPIALLCSLVGLRRAPRGMAAFGTLFSLGGTAILALMITGIAVSCSHEQRSHQRAAEMRVLKEKKQKTQVMLDVVTQQLKTFQQENGELPDALQGNILAVAFQDAWGTPLRYDAEQRRCTVRSAGADQRFETADDLTRVIAGDVPDTGINSIRF